MRIVSSLGERSTPKSEGESFSIGFFLAFMIFGSDAYLGSTTRCEKGAKT